jgi:hypothetical protein
MINMPMKIPIGEDIAKQKIRSFISRSFPGKVLSRLMPRDIPAIPLCTAIAINIPIVFPKVVQRPRASPSKKECTERAIMIMNGVVFRLQHFFFSGSCTSAASSNT